MRRIGRVCSVWIVLIAAHCCALAQAQDPAAAEYNRGEDPTTLGMPSHLWIADGSAGVPVPYQVFEGFALVEADILLARLGAGPKNAFVNRAALWPRGIVVYQIDPALSERIQSRVLAAIEHWEIKTGLRFSPRNLLSEKQDSDFVDIGPGSGCAAQIGHVGGRQQLLLSDACGLGNIIHELGHAVGLLHTHTRVDRDQFIDVLAANVAPNYLHNFQLNALPNVQPVGPYDYSSIMHYGRTAFSVNGDDTIVPGAQVAIGQRSGLSVGDVAIVQKIYATDLALTLTESATGSPQRVQLPLDINNVAEFGANDLSISVSGLTNISVVGFSGAGWDCDISTAVVCHALHLDAAQRSALLLTFDISNLQSEREIVAVLDSKTADYDLSNNTVRITISGDGQTISSASAQANVRPEIVRPTHIPLPTDVAAGQVIGVLETRDADGDSVYVYKSGGSASVWLDVTADGQIVINAPEALANAAVGQTLELVADDGVSAPVAHSIIIGEDAQQSNSDGVSPPTVVTQQASSGGGAVHAMTLCALIFLCLYRYRSLFFGSKVTILSLFLPLFLIACNDLDEQPISPSIPVVHDAAVTSPCGQDARCADTPELPGLIAFAGWQGGRVELWHIDSDGTQTRLSKAQITDNSGSIDPSTATLRASVVGDNWYLLKAFEGALWDRDFDGVSDNPSGELPVRNLPLTALYSGQELLSEPWIINAATHVVAQACAYALSIERIDKLALRRNEVSARLLRKDINHDQIVDYSDLRYRQAQLELDDIYHPTAWVRYQNALTNNHAALEIAAELVQLRWQSLSFYDVEDIAVHEYGLYLATRNAGLQVGTFVPGQGLVLGESSPVSGESIKQVERSENWLLAVTDQGSVIVYDASSALELIEKSRIVLNENITDIAVYNQYLFILDGTSRVKIYSIENPSSAEFVKDYELGSQGLQVDVHQARLYVSRWGAGVDIYDIESGADLQYVAGLSEPYSAGSLSIVGDTLVASGQSDAHWYHLTTAGAQLSGLYQSERYISASTSYFGSIYLSVQNGDVIILSQALSSPSKAVVSAVLPAAGESSAVLVANNTLHLALRDKGYLALQIADIFPALVDDYLLVQNSENLQYPRDISGMVSLPDKLIVEDRNLGWFSVVPNVAGGTFTHLLAPILSSKTLVRDADHYISFDDAGAYSRQKISADGIDIVESGVLGKSFTSSNNAQSRFIAEKDFGLRIMDLEQALNAPPKLRVPFADIHHVVANDRVAVMLGDQRAAVIDISNPGQIASIIALRSDFAKAVLYRNFLVVADGIRGVLTYDLSDPSAPQLLQQLNIAEVPGFLLHYGTNIVFVDQYLGIYFLTIDNEGLLKLRGFQEESGQFLSAHIDENNLYLFQQDRGLKVYPIAK